MHRLATTIAVVVALAAALPAVASANTTTILVPSMLGGAPATCTLNSSELYLNRTGTRVFVDITVACPPGTQITGNLWIQDPTTQKQLTRTPYAGTGSATATASAACPKGGGVYQGYVWVHAVVPGPFFPYDVYVPGVIAAFDCPYN
jgi:hypothetical protein